MIEKYSNSSEKGGSIQLANVGGQDRSPEGAIPESTSTSIPDSQVKANQRVARRRFNLSYKLKILEEYDSYDNALERGALLRREALYHSVLSNWRKQRDAGKFSAKTKGKTSKTLLMNQQLTRENAQLKKKLAQAEAIIELQKKVSDLFGTHILPVKSKEMS